MQIDIPQNLRPADGRFGSGPAKVRREALEYLLARADVMGTSHRQAPVRGLVQELQEALSDLYRLPEGYEVTLGNGGATAFWDVAVFSLIAERSAHGVFGEFSRKFSTASAKAPFLGDPRVFEAPPGSVALPKDCDADTYCWAQNETSTGASAPVRRIGDGLVLVDATSAAGGIDADIASTDAYYFAPQKNFSSDGGMWFAFLSPAAVERAESIAAGGRWIPDFLDLSSAIKNSRQHQSVNTPAIATLLMMADQVRWMQSLGGMPAVAARCASSTSIVYDWAEQRDWATPFVANPEHRSPVVATIDLDDTVDAKQVSAILRENGIVDVDPYRALNRNQLRIGCYAAVDPSDVEKLVACIDHVVERLAP
ncbi:phosphoserine transaminase [Tessaracoccus antarcticus]|uniref:phosphoserine transaminase n=1 Tax=Tessaracoccus antarcticus TaxID=2479848 RepID=UPI001F2171E6|nr:phosphoserine transaminase [Tessaracoccus antarcticus]